MKKRKIVITGLGVIAPNGTTKEAFWETVKNGKPIISQVTRFNTDDFPTKIAAEINDFDPAKYMDHKEVRRLDLATQFAVAASNDAVKDAQLIIERENCERIGICDGTSLGGAEWALDQHKKYLEGSKRINPLLPVYGFPGACSGKIAVNLGIKGSALTVCAGSASSATAIIYGYNSILFDDNDIMLVGGSEAPLHALMFGSLCALKTMSTKNALPNKACKPFDLNRDGFVVGEGGAFLILEELEHALQRKAQIYAEVSGCAMTCDSFHMSAPEPSGEQISRAIIKALKKAEIGEHEVDYINAHGTSTLLNDRVETLAIKKAFGKHAYNLLVSSTKPVTGHLFGAAGSIELAICALAIKEGIVPPTINYETPDPECDLNYVPNKFIKKDIKAVLSCSYGFGGKNACIVLQKYE